MNVDEYIDTLPEDRRIAIRTVRELVNSHIPAGYEEGMQYGMISWFVPFTTLAETYNNQPLALVSLGSQKSHMALYMMSVYGDENLKAWFESAFKKAGKKLDMGKSCVRFKTLEALPLEVIGEALTRVSVDEYVAKYHAVRAATKTGAAKPPEAAKPAALSVASKLAAMRPAAKSAAAPKKPAPAAKKTAKPAKVAAKKASAKKPAKKTAAKRPDTKSKKRR
ncbi:MAG: hypothetical protein JWO36_5711 [Myxococcales bacterium]|nr:hypothetical protein [Myxococcales bacterium]